MGGANWYVEGLGSDSKGIGGVENGIKERENFIAFCDGLVLSNFTDIVEEKIQVMA